MRDVIYHITQAEQWAKAVEAGQYTAESLVTEGFIHCSTAAQVVGVANRFYAGQRGLVLLCIDHQRVSADVAFETPINPETRRPEAGSSELFPHIYGPLNLEAVVEVVPFEAGADGTFTLPAGVG